mgnify:CR=1 FL=1
MFRVAFWRDTAERAVATFAETLAAVVGAGYAGLLDVPWTSALSAAGLAAVLAVVKAVAVAGVGDVGTAGLVRTRRLP